MDTYIGFLSLPFLLLPCLSDEVPHPFRATWLPFRPVIPPYFHACLSTKALANAFPHGQHGHGHGHGHGHSLSMSAMSGHSYQPHQEQNHHRNQQQQPQQHLNQSQDQIQRGVSPMGYVLGQSRRSSSASGAPADGPMERMYLPSASMTSSSSSSPAHTHASVNATGVSTIKLPTLLGNSQVVEGERQREGGAVKEETSGKCDVSIFFNCDEC